VASIGPGIQENKGAARSLLGSGGGVEFSEARSWLAGQGASIEFSGGLPLAVAGQEVVLGSVKVCRSTAPPTQRQDRLRGGERERAWGQSRQPTSFP